MDMGPPKKLLSMNFLEFVQSRDCRWRWKRQWERGIGKKCAAELEECKGQGGNPGVGGVGVEKYRHGEGRNTCKECEEI